MAKFVCAVRSSYGEKGQVVELKGVEVGALTDRQKALLKPFTDDVKVIEVATPKAKAAK